MESATENMFTFHDWLLVDRKGGLYDDCDDDADGEERIIATVEDGLFI